MGRLRGRSKIGGLLEPMPGGASLAMHRVTVTLADGDSARMVLRRYVRPDQVADDPAVAAHEAAVLELVERIATPTPRLIGVDPTGEHAGTPAVVMTELPRPATVGDQPALDAPTGRGACRRSQPSML